MKKLIIAGWVCLVLTAGLIISMIYLRSLFSSSLVIGGGLYLWMIYIVVTNLILQQVIKKNFNWAVKFCGYTGVFNLTAIIILFCVAAVKGGTRTQILSATGIIMYGMICFYYLIFTIMHFTKIEKREIIEI
ncbi:MAG: hypothetical protein ABI723_21595 [Bacteroidia bacterium]